MVYIYLNNNASMEKYNRMSKNELYQIAKTIDGSIPYSKSTKKVLLEFISENMNKLDTVPDTISSNCVMVSDNYTAEYIENLLSQIEFHKKQAEKWQNLYISALIEHNTLGTVPNHQKPQQTFTNPVHISKPVEILLKTEPIKSPIKPSKPFDNLDESVHILNDTPTSQKIKEKSLLMAINMLTEKEIRDFGFDSRLKIYESRKKDIKKSTNIMCQLKKRNK